MCFRALVLIALSATALIAQEQTALPTTSKPEKAAGKSTPKTPRTTNPESVPEKPANTKNTTKTEPAKPQQKPKSAKKSTNRATIMARTTYWILLKDDTYLKGQLVVLPSNNYLIINSQYLDGRLLKRSEVKRIGDTDFRAIEGLPKKKSGNPLDLARLGAYMGFLSLSGDIEPTYSMGVGFGFVYQTGLVSFSKRLAKFYGEPRITYYNASSNDENFGNLNFFRFGFSLGYRIYEVPLRNWGQRVSAYTGFGYGLTWFNHETAGSNSFGSLLFHAGVAYTVFSTSWFALQITGEADFEKQSSYVVTPGFGFRALGRFW